MATYILGKDISRPKLRRMDRMVVETALQRMYPSFQYRDLFPFNLINGPLIPDALVQGLPTGLERIVIVGCGTGILANTLALLFPDVEVIGIDPNPIKICIAKRTIGRRRNIKFISGNALVMAPIPCDRIIFQQCMPWYETEKAFKTLLSKTVRWLKAEGDFVICESSLALLLKPVHGKNNALAVIKKRGLEGYLRTMLTELGFSHPYVAVDRLMPGVDRNIYLRYEKLPLAELLSMSSATSATQKVKEWHNPTEQNSEAVLSFLFEKGRSVENLTQELHLR